jgi:four helix bundle protein
MNYSRRRNLNRGYKKLDVWQRGMDLFEMAFRLAAAASDFKLKSQFTDAAQSVSANIAEGYGRRSLPEYLQFLYISKGSLAEALTRACGFWRVQILSDSDFEAFDQLHYEVENELLSLISALETKRGTDEWQTSLPTHPPPQQSNDPPIH